MQNILYIDSIRGILNNADRRRSILVRSAVSEGGPNNPLKGISMKPLVLA